MILMAAPTNDRAMTWKIQRPEILLSNQAIEEEKIKKKNNTKPSAPIQ